MSASDHLSPQQFYHGTPQRFQPGDVIAPGHEPHSGIRTEHVFLSTSKRNAKGWGASDDPATGEWARWGHVYEVTTPTSYEPDHAGNAVTGTRANYKTREPVTVVRKVKA
jgi:rifampin ADP-ribosylating transferase